MSRPLATVQGRATSPLLTRRPAKGFTYIGVLILLAIMAMVGAVGVKLGAIVHRRCAEEALLDVGGEFSNALSSYRRFSPTGKAGEPQTLEELLRDPRFPGTVRHLRKLYSDPMTGQAEWGLVRSEETKGIIGGYSLSTAKPIKTGSFESRFSDFAGKTSYQDWLFTPSQASVLSIEQRSRFASPGEGRDDVPDSTEIIYGPQTVSPPSPRGSLGETKN